eukprot:TRINITY_DN1136_c1_g3_i1.p1 TRINITY_DN1136_c1_g3~~TRINITY_DN1136_c1_g3_i1.p1  ORF type:complete len:430 (+),score=72.89 TRINITY_DN1136_c1_g3_i1:1117-2406(+)
MYAIQYVKYKEIRLGVANMYTEHIKENIYDDYEELFAWYKQIYTPLELELDELCLYIDDTELIEYISNAGISQLERRFSIIPNIREDGLVELKGSHYNTPPNINSCGLVVDISNFNIVCNPVHRVKDHNKETLFSYKEATYWKLPIGIYINLFYFKGKWHTSTYHKDSYYVNCYLERHDIELKDLTNFIQPIFWNSWNDKQYLLPSDTSTTYTFIYHPEENYIYYYGTSNNFRLDFENSSEYNWLILETVDITAKSQSMYSCLKLQADQLSPLFYEGILGCDDSTTIVQRSELVKNMSFSTPNFCTMISRKIFDIYFLLVRACWNEHEKFIEYFPGLSLYFEYVLDKFQYCCEMIDDTYMQYKHLQSRDFAIKVDSLDILPLLKKILKNLKKWKCERATDYFGSLNYLYSPGTKRTFLRLMMNVCDVYK